MVLKTQINRKRVLEIGVNRLVILEIEVDTHR